MITLSDSGPDSSLSIGNVLEIILFRSVSTGNYDEESEIDLLIILDIDEIPESYEEKMELKLNIRRSEKIF